MSFYFPVSTTEVLCDSEVAFIGKEKMQLVVYFSICCETETYLHHGLFQHYITMWDNSLREQYRNTVVLAGVQVVRSRVRLPILDITG